MKIKQIQKFTNKLSERIPYKPNTERVTLIKVISTCKPFLCQILNQNLKFTGYKFFKNFEKVEQI